MSIDVYRELLGKADTDDIRRGREWYPTMSLKVSTLADETGYTPSQVAGVVAVLSPMVEWSLNWKSAQRFCRTKGNTKGIPGFSQNKQKAKKILANKKTVEKYVKGPKVNAFYNSLLDPAYPEPVIDTQMIAAFFAGVAYRDDFKIVSTSTKRLQPIREAVATLAGEKGWTISEMQAVLWITFKRVNGPYADQLKLFK